MFDFDIQANFLISITFFLWALALYLVNVRGKRKRLRDEAWRRDSERRWN